MSNRYNLAHVLVAACTLVLVLLTGPSAQAAGRHVGHGSIPLQQDDREGPAVATVSPVTTTTSLTTSRTLTGVTGITGTGTITTGTNVVPEESNEESDTGETDTGESDAVDAAETGAEATDGQAAPDAPVEYGDVLSGTILANRTELSVRFFVEGQTYLLDPLRSVGLDLPRVSAILNLFNCDAFASESEEDCYWDPYLLDRDSFYEIVEDAPVGGLATLTLREAGTPESGEIWIQNRTGNNEVIVYRNAIYELLPSAVEEFVVESDELPTFFLRSCVSVDEESACEWLPMVGEPGIYYSLVEVETSGGLSGSTLSTLELRAILDDDEPLIERPLQILCRLQVPVLNVRSGPGLEYQIVAKIRGTEDTPATVLVNGRDAVANWLSVDDRVVDGGWIAGNPSYVTCDGDLRELPEMEVTDGRLAPTPEPAPVAVEQGETVADAPVEGEPATEDEEAVDAVPTPVNVPDGLALLTVNNAFDHEIRFTMDQTYRVELGPSEIDLQPGESANVLVYPGFIAFSASSPWSGLSGNADFFLEADQTRVLWLLFAPDPDGSGRWIMLY